MTTICLSGSMEFSDYYQKDSITLAQERGQWPYSDGIYRMWVDCKVVDKFIKTTFFGGRKYYLVVKMMGTTKELQVNEHNYYTESPVTQIRMWSNDRKIWYPERV